MKLLLDTHTFLWHADGDPRMRPWPQRLLLDPANELFLSMASVWEIAIKVGLKKLTLSAPYVTFMTRAITGYGLTAFPMTLDDCVAYEQLPFPSKQHRDPFDRMIVIHAFRRGSRRRCNSLAASKLEICIFVNTFTCSSVHALKITCLRETSCVYGVSGLSTVFTGSRCAFRNGLSVIGVDVAFDPYGVTRLW